MTSAVRRVGPLALAILVAACATPPPAPVERSESSRLPAPVPAAAAPRRAAPYLKELPDRPLNATAKCQFVDPDGYQGRLRLAVRDARVEQLEAQVVVPARGVCRFVLDDFTQTATRPVTLKHRKSGCLMHMWEQGRRVTVAFGECRSLCSGGAQDYLWPILIDAGDGTCG